MAKMTATLDVMSGGRVEFGIGAGWVKREHEAYGLLFPPIKTRIKQLEEYLQILRKMWLERKPSFHGKYYSITNSINEPKPLQKPHPPISIGTRLGGKKMLNIIEK